MSVPRIGQGIRAVSGSTDGMCASHKANDGLEGDGLHARGQGWPDQDLNHGSLIQRELGDAGQEPGFGVLCDSRGGIWLSAFFSSWPRVLEHQGHVDPRTGEEYTLERLTRKGRRH